VGASVMQPVPAQTVATVRPAYEAADRLKRGFPWAEATRRVETRLALLGKFAPGHCLWAAVVGAAELRKHGLAPVIQAGSAAWPRMPKAEAEARGELDTMHFAYEWRPDSDHSREVMATGGMPEYHAWVGVPTGRDVPGDPREQAGVVVDFAAHWAAQVCGEVGLAWKNPPPERPLLHSANDAEDTRAQHDGHAPIYNVEPEAVLFVSLAARWVVTKAFAAGYREEVADLWREVGVTDIPNATSPRKVAQALATLPREMLAATRRFIATLPGGKI